MYLSHSLKKKIFYNFFLKAFLLAGMVTGVYKVNAQEKYVVFEMIFAKKAEYDLSLAFF